MAWQNEVKTSYLRNGIFSGIAAAITTVLALRSKSSKEEPLFNEYRPEIAKAMGKAAEDVSPQDWEYFKRNNPALQQVGQAMRLSAKDWAAVLLTAIGGGFLAGEGSTRVVKNRNEGSLKADGSKIAGGTFGILGGAFLGGQVRKLIYDHALPSRLENTAHGLIMGMKEKLLGGEKITPSEVLALQVSINPKIIAPHILMRGNAAQAEKLKSQYPELMEQNARLADALNEGNLRPQQLIFALGKDGQWDVGQALKETPRQDAVQSVKVPEREWGRQERVRQEQEKKPAQMAM